MNGINSLTGTVIVSKMPALHPGDVRKLEAVPAERVPGLAHMVDVIVFPQKVKRHVRCVI
jgi:RNA-dependent RNA polymerase